MSIVSGITIICSLGEDDSADPNFPTLFQRANDWIKAHGVRDALRPVQEFFGGGKHPQCFVAGAGLNYFSENEFADFVMALPWRDPENVVLVIQPEHGATRVFRPPS